MLETLKVIDSCDGCSACCMEQSSPPGYVAVLSDYWGDEEDIERVRHLPGEAMSVLREYRIRLLDEDIKGERLCCWLDLLTKRCRWHEHRPNICREFEVGSKSCRDWREDYQQT